MSLEEHDRFIKFMKRYLKTLDKLVSEINAMDHEERLIYASAVCAYIIRLTTRLPTEAYGILESIKAFIHSETAAIMELAKFLMKRPEGVE